MIKQNFAFPAGDGPVPVNDPTKSVYDQPKTSLVGVDNSPPVYIGDGVLVDKSGKYVEVLSNINIPNEIKEWLDQDHVKYAEY